MMRLFNTMVLLATVMLAGCATPVPVESKFPPVPEQLMNTCPQLKTIEGDVVTISQFTKTVVTNYATYHDCVAKNNAWIEWYQTQKKIYERK